MVLAGLDCQHYAAHGTAAFAQASKATHKLLDDLIWYCDDVVVIAILSRTRFTLHASSPLS